MESSGPEGGKVRGPAALIYERYLQMARDAAASGDRVLGENFLQHADHYFRLVRAMQPAQPPPQQMSERLNEDGGEGEEPAAAEAESGEDAELAAEAGEQPDVDYPQGQQQFEREGEPRRRRGRRSRYRPSDGEAGERREAREGEDDAGEARESRRERAPRGRDENAGPEGFSDGPKPAFLRD